MWVLVWRFRVLGSGFKVQALGVRVCGLGVRLEVRLRINVNDFNWYFIAETLSILCRVWCSLVMTQRRRLIGRR